MSGKAAKVLYRLYTLLGTGCLPVVYLLAPLANLVGGRFFHRLNERLARYPLPVSGPPVDAGKRIWLHAASVGEIQVAANIIAELELHGLSRFFLTVMTEQGRLVAEKKFAGRVTCLMAPLDIPCIVRRLIAHIRPDIFICVETELWPALLDTVRLAGIGMALVNGRISSRSFCRYRRISGLMQRLLSGFQAIVVIRFDDRERFVALGAPRERVRVGGNCKYTAAPDDRAGMRDRCRKRLNLDPADRVFITGSTRSGEEELLLPVYQRLRLESDKRLVWIVAPRHLQRLGALQDFFGKNELPVTLFSECAPGRRSTDIILVDCMGELADLYAAGDFNFCGGSLVDKGGHNIMEVVHWGLPVYFGPFMQDFLDAVDMVIPAGAGFQVKSSDELASILIRHLHEKKEYDRACRAAVALGRHQNQALRVQVEAVCRLLSEKG